jgi:hypothetical protein
MLVRKVEATLMEEGAQAKELRARLLARMHDLSMFLKELKQRFTMWFNARFELYGTIWAERFKSILVENDTSVLRVVGAYIDLNPLRASIVSTPKDYRWCGMAAAERGDPLAQAGLISLMRAKGWSEAKKAYRQFVDHAAVPQANDNRTGARNVQKAETPLAAPCLMARQRSLSDSPIVGSPHFVREQWQAYREHRG